MKIGLPGMVRTRTFRRLLRWFVTIALGAYLMWGTEIDAVFGALGGAVPSLIAVAIGLYAIDRVAAAFKWRVLFLALGERISLWRAAVAYLQSSYLGAALPATVGMDVIRAQLVASRGEGGFGRAITSVAMERFLGIAALTGVAGFGLIVLAPADAVQSATGAWMVLAVMLGTGAVVLAIAARKGGGQNTEDPARGLVAMVKKVWASARASLRVYHERRRSLALVLAIAVGQQYLLTFINWVLARSVGLDVTLVTMLWVWPLVMIAVRIPISVMGFGVREALLFALAGAGGYSRGTAVSLGLLSGFLDLLFVGLGGALLLAGVEAGSLTDSDREVSLSGEGSGSAPPNDRREAPGHSGSGVH